MESMKRSNRSIVICLRLSPEEKEAFTAMAERLGTDLSELLRQLAHKALRSEESGKAA